MQWEWTLTSLCTSLDRALDVKLYLVNCHDVTSIYTNIYILATPCVTASFVIRQFILSTLSDNPCYYFTFWGPFIVAVSYVIPHLQPTYRNHQSWWGKYPYIHTRISTWMENYLLQLIIWDHRWHDTRAFMQN